MAGERGIGILINRTFGSHFVLQSRGVSHADEALLGNDVKRPYSTNISATWGITYCPWCGYSLTKLMDEHPDDFDRLAHSHQLLLPSDWQA